ncbi:hypothetical protein ASD77_08185 [Pseudoxanthomonas sp. Root65]|nr:hypothetical protein ASD77_08185 [Pseudoxanthomonas sp. Root65]
MGPATAIAIQERSAGAAVAGRNGIDDSDGTGRRNGDCAGGGLRFALQLGGFLLEHLQHLFGIAARLVALVGVEDQQCGEYADADGHADLPGEAVVVMRGR